MKANVTNTVDIDILLEAREIAEKKHITVSRYVQDALAEKNTREKKEVKDKSISHR